MMITVVFEDNIRMPLEITQEEIEKINMGKRFIVGCNDTKEVYINTQQVKCLLSNDNVFTEMSFDEY